MSLYVDRTHFFGYNSTDDISLDIGSVSDYSFLAVTNRLGVEADNKVCGVLGLGRNKLANDTDEYMPSLP